MSLDLRIDITKDESYKMQCSLTTLLFYKKYSLNLLIRKLGTVVQRDINFQLLT